MGYHQAGFEVAGVDIAPQPRYPFHFIQADALEYLRDHGHEYDAIAASPPCQASTTISNRWRGKGGKADSHINLIPETFQALEATGKLWVLENVMGARAHLRTPIILRGGAFGLRVERPRFFETNFPLQSPARVAVKNPVGVYGALDGRRLTQHPRADGTHQYAARGVEEASAAMGINWMTARELAEAIPPAYTHYIGNHLKAHLLASGAE